jgi:hypothetical protein
MDDAYISVGLRFTMAKILATALNRVTIAANILDFRVIISDNVPHMARRNLQNIC